MAAFWQKLADVAQGQLFSGGYLSPEAVAKLTAKRKTADCCCAEKNTASKKVWPRLANPH